MSTTHINLTPFLNTLRSTHRNISVAVLSKQDYSFYKHHGVNIIPFTLQELEDGRALLSTDDDAYTLARYLQLRGMDAESWIELEEFDDRYDEAIYVANVNLDYARFQTGMLDENFGYVAAHSRRRGLAAEFIDDRDTLSPDEFDAKYELLAKAQTRVS